MTAPYDHDALWLKAKLFLSLALEDGDTRTFDERALWASLALELLGKAALARVSPLLIAVPTEEGANILIAAGLMGGEARFESIKAHTLFSRCSRAFKPFSDRQAQAISRARNDYLHGGAANFTQIPPEAWWPRYWGAGRRAGARPGPDRQRTRWRLAECGSRTPPRAEREERRAPHRDAR